MELEEKKTMSYVIKLTENEAVWLKQRMQNAIGHLDDEPEHDRHMRMAFWKALEKVEL